MLSALPHYEAFVAGLPDGLDSYPEHFTKSALLRCMTTDGLRARAHELPEPLRELVCRPPPTSSWVRQVHANAVVQLARDVTFASDREFADFCYDAQRQLFSSSLYRLLMRCTSPARVLSTAQHRWSAFNRGTSATALVSSRTGRVCIEHPIGLFDAVTRIAMSEALRATLDLSRAGKASVSLGSCTNTRTELHAHW